VANIACSRTGNRLAAAAAVRTLRRRPTRRSSAAAPSGRRCATGRSFRPVSASSWPRPPSSSATGPRSVPLFPIPFSSFPFYRFVINNSRKGNRQWLQSSFSLPLLIPWNWSHLSRRQLWEPFRDPRLVEMKFFYSTNFLFGFQVYRAEGATQWYTAVIVSHDEETGVSTWLIFANKILMKTTQ